MPCKNVANCPLEAKRCDNCLNNEQPGDGPQPGMTSPLDNFVEDAKPCAEMFPFPGYMA